MENKTEEQEQQQHKTKDDDCFKKEYDL